MTQRRDSEVGSQRWPLGRLLPVAGLVLAILAGVVVAAALDLGLWIEASLTPQIEALGAWGPVAVVLLMILHCFVPFPAEILALCSGAVFGAIWGAVLIWAGALLGAALSFWLARRLGRPAVERLLPSRHARALNQWTADQGVVSLLMARFVPVIAFNLVNYAAGLTRIGWWPFLWTTGVGILPLTLVMTWIGAEMRELGWREVLAVSAAGLAAVWIASRFMRWR